MESEFELGSNLAPWLRAKALKAIDDYEAEVIFQPVPEGSKPFSFIDYRGGMQTIVVRGEPNSTERRNWQRLYNKYYGETKSKPTNYTNTNLDARGFVKPLAYYDDDHPANGHMIECNKMNWSTTGSAYNNEGGEWEKLLRVHADPKTYLRRPSVYLETSDRNWVRVKGYASAGMI